MPIRKRGCWIARDTPRRLPRHRLLINYQQAKADRPLTTSMRTSPRGSQKAIVEPAHGLGVMIDGIFLQAGVERRSRAAESEQRETARIDAALDLRLPNGVGLVPVGDLDDAVGELFDAHRAGKPLRQARESLARTCSVERHSAADERRRDAPENKIGIGDGRLGAAVGVAHRAGFGGRALRPDLEVAFAIWQGIAGLETTNGRTIWTTSH